MRHRRIQGEDQGGVHRRHGSGNRGGAVMSYFQARLAEVQIPPKKPQKYLFHVPRTMQDNPNLRPIGQGFGFLVFIKDIEV